MRRPAIALLGIACAIACKGKKSDEAAPAPAPPPAPADAAARPLVPDKIEGTLTLDGKPVEILRCRPGRQAAIYVDLVTAAGALRFVGGQASEMYWNPRPEEDARGTAIACAIPHRSWGGGTRGDGTTYFRGELAFSCLGGPGALAGTVTVDCGNISPLERKLLDEGRRRKREELQEGGPEAPPPR